MISPSWYLEWMTIKLFGWVDECGSAGTAGKAMTKPQETNSTESHHSDLKQLRCPSGLRGTTQVRVAGEPAAGEKNPTRSTFFMPLLFCFVIAHVRWPLPRPARFIASPFLFYLPLLLLPLSSLPLFLRRGARPEVRVVVLHARSPLFSSSSF